MSGFLITLLSNYQAVALIENRMLIQHFEISFVTVLKKCGKKKKLFIKMRPVRSAFERNPAMLY